MALTLLTVGLIPAFLQATSALGLSTTIRNSLISAHLAQEGAETVRAMRDTNWFAKQPFDTGLTGCASGCLVQWDSSAPQPLGANPPLKWDTGSGLYQYDTGTDTAFHRVVTVTAVSGHELKVQSTVTWKERTTDKTFSVEDHLYDWFK